MRERASAVLGTLGFLVAAFLSRETQSLTFDELFTVWVSAQPWDELIRQANLDGFTPPSFYAVVKTVGLFGLRNEALRIVPVLFASLAVFLGLRASDRLFGPSARLISLLIVPSSAWVFTFGHELRPYSALMACAMYVLGELAGQFDGRRATRAAVAALLATALSYFGVMLVAVWILRCGSRSPVRTRLTVLIGALLLATPGILKILRLTTMRADVSLEWTDARPTASGILLGLAPLPLATWIQILLSAVIVAVFFLAARAQAASAVRFLAVAASSFSVMLIALNAVTPVGFAPRYFALPMSAFLLCLVGVTTRNRAIGAPVAVLFFLLNAAAIVRYLSVDPPPREDWRAAMGVMQTRLGSEGTLLAFPFHHAAVAASAYAPELRLGGGYTSKNGPVFWYEPPATFRGYAFDDLTRIDDVRPLLRRLGGASDVCLLSDEPDPTKTARLFQAFEGLGNAVVVATGDARLRAVCRPRG